jgi:hypothetical protein
LGGLFVAFCFLANGLVLAWPIVFWVLLPQQRQQVLYLATLLGFAGVFF